jgi:medium-chain acyl-[acyl-carrier-protein] hydrolase
VTASPVILRGNAWLEHVSGNPRAAWRLFCFPYAGGSAAIYRRWGNGPLADCEVCPVQIPGRERRIAERPIDRMTRLAGAVAAALPLDKPFALFGHSMGALLAFETTRQLRRLGAPAPFHLFVSGAPAPQLCPNRPQRHRLGHEQFQAEVRKLGGTPEEVFADPELLDLVLPTLRADFAAIDTYIYRDEAAFACPITALAGDRDREVDHFEVMEWRAQTQARFHFHLFAGDHFFITESSDSVRSLVAAALGFTQKLNLSAP